MAEGSAQEEDAHQVDDVIRKWEERMTANLEWRDRYFALKEERDRKPRREGGVEVEALREENEALRVKCEVLLEALDVANSTTPKGMRQVKSMRGNI